VVVVRLCVIRVSVRFEILVTVNVNFTVFWNVTSYSLEKLRSPSSG
jgi:hypothetical protein